MALVTSILFSVFRLNCAEEAFTYILRYVWQPNPKQLLNFALGQDLLIGKHFKKDGKDNIRILQMPILLYCRLVLASPSQINDLI